MREIFVDPLAGSDGGNGSTANPLLTLGKWAQNAEVGDRVIVRTTGGTEKPGARWTVPGVRLEADGEVIVVPPPGLPHNCLRCDVPPGFPKTDLPAMIAGFTTRGGSQCGIWVTFCENMAVMHNTVLDGNVWGIHCAQAVNGIKVLFNRVYRTYHQHGIYVTGSVDGFEVRGNVLDYLWLQGIHINGDEASSREVGSPDPHGWMKNGTVADNVIRRAGWSLIHPQLPNTHRGGGGMDADACDRVVYRNNRVIDCKGWGINIHTSQTNRSRFVTIEDNVVETGWTCVNINNASEDVTVRNNVLSHGNADWRYFDHGDPVRLVWEDNTEIRSSPFTAEYVATLPAVEPPVIVVPPPPPPPPPPPELEPLPPATDPRVLTGVPADESLVDDTDEALLLLEYDTRDSAGPQYVPPAMVVPFSAYNELATPVRQYGRGGSGSPVKQPAGHGFNVSGFIRPPQTGVYELHLVGCGVFSFRIAGVVSWDDHLIGAGGGERKTNSFFVHLEGGKAYPYRAAVMGNGDYLIAYTFVRGPGMPERTLLPTSWQRPPKAVPPSPPGPGPGPNPDPGPDPDPDPPAIGFTLTRAELLDLLQRGMGRGG